MSATQKEVTFVVVEGGCHKCTSHYGKTYTFRPRQQLGYRSKSIVRLLWEKKHGRVLNRKEILRHSCDNPWCINVDHVTAGTQAENIQDAVNKGRMARGEDAGPSVLTKEQVLKILELYNADLYSDSSIAKMFGVTRKAISHIGNGRSWGWLTEGKRIAKKKRKKHYASPEMVIESDKAYSC